MEILQGNASFQGKVGPTGKEVTDVSSALSLKVPCSEAPVSSPVWPGIRTQWQQDRAEPNVQPHVPSCAFPLEVTAAPPTT